MGKDEIEGLQDEITEFKQNTTELYDRLCDLLDCQNGGVCNEGVCMCQLGYHGTSCEKLECKPRSDRKSCNSIKDRKECLTAVENRQGWEDSPCVWCLTDHCGPYKTACEVQKYWE